jgi:toxin ParE1/3/4
MTRRILLHQDAIFDVNEHFGYFVQENPDRAFQFFDAARQTFADLARMPGMGSVYDSENEHITNIRK